MKKHVQKLFALFCTAALLVGLFPAAPAQAAGTVVDSGSCGDTVTWTLTSEGTLTLSGEGSTWAYPEEYPPFFDYVEAITSIVVEAGVTSIGDYLFFELYNVTEVSLPNTLTYIGECAFGYCLALTRVSLPNSVTDMGMGVFMYCIGLFDAKLSTGMDYVPAYTFYCCVALGGVAPFSNVRTIEEGAFAGCTGLLSLEFPDRLEVIGPLAFCACSELQYVSIPDSVTVIDAGAFSYCGAIQQIMFWGDAPYFGEECFYETTADCRYPATCEGWTEDVLQTYGGGITWTAYTPCPHDDYIDCGSADPTCTEEGYAHYQCLICGKNFSEYTPATGHDYGEWYVSREATCALDGEERRDCVKCGQSETRSILPDCPSLIFTDVGRTAWYHPYVDFVVERGLMNGTGGNQFSPDLSIDRASFVTILYRMAGSPEVEGEHPFTDLTADWYADAVLWAYQNNVTTGTGDGTTFSPTDKITREQLVTMLQRFANIMGYELKAPGNVDVEDYPDCGQIAEWALDSVNWACDMGLISGRAVGGETLLAPKETASRAEIATIFMRFCGLVEN